MNESGRQPPSYSVRQAVLPGQGNDTRAHDSQNEIFQDVMAARTLLAKQRIALDAEQLTMPGDVLDDIELQFVSGVLSAFVDRAAYLPNSSRDELAMRLIHFLVAERGVAPAQARKQVMSVERLREQAEPLFVMIASAGGAAASGPGITHLAQIVRALRDGAAA